MKQGSLIRIREGRAVEPGVLWMVIEAVRDIDILIASTRTGYTMWVSPGDIEVVCENE